MNWEERFLELKQAFDASFAELPRAAEGDQADFLALRCGGEPWALRLQDIAALVHGKKVTPLPGSPPELLGLAGFRGVTVPVYALDGLLSLSRQPAPEWMVLSATATRVALAFESFEGHLRVPRSQVVLDATRHHVDSFVEGRPVIALEPVLQDLTVRVRGR